MDELRSEQESILAELRELEDPFARYSYLLALAALLKGYPEEKRTKEYAVQGCQSSVWLTAWSENGRFRFLADSDTYIIKGLLYLLSNVLDDRPLAAVAQSELTFWRDPLLLGSFEEQRRKGLGYVAATLQAKAAALLETEATVIKRSKEKENKEADL